MCVCVCVSWVPWATSRFRTASDSVTCVPNPCRPHLHHGFRIYVKDFLENSYIARFNNKYIRGSSFSVENGDHEACINKVYDRCVAFTEQSGGAEGLSRMISGPPG